MKVEKSGYNFKKYIIHTLVAGALAISLGTVNHVNNYINSHFPVHQSKAKSKSKPKQKSTLTYSSTIDEGVSPPPPPPPTIAPEQQSAPVVAKAEVAPAQAATASPAPAPVTPKVGPIASSAPAPVEQAASPQTAVKAPTLIEAVAAKVGVHIIDSTGVSITQSKIDTGFIRKVEGSVTKGYVPLPGKTQSGVTIGDGFDLGQMRQGEFDKLPIAEALKTKLKPYIGLKRYAAVNFLKAHPLSVSEDELKELNVVAANKILQPLVAEYNKVSGKSFFSLPAEAQTAIFSYAYQYGAGFMHKAHAKQLWHYFTTQDWQKASSTLRSSKMYASRRVQEAKLLEDIA